MTDYRAADWKPWTSRFRWHLTASVVGFSARWVSDPWSDVLMGAGFGFIALDLLLKFYFGYVRRRPHWTLRSWGRFGVVCGLSIAALVMTFAFGFAVDAKLPIVGAGRSPQRMLWTIAAMACMLGGAWGLASSAHTLASGDPTMQYTWRRVKIPKS